MVYETDDNSAALEKLATELNGRGFQCRLVQPVPELSCLEVCNPQVRALSERILAQSGWFWWPWAERLARTGDVVGAAPQIVRVLRTVPKPTS